jgi:Fe-S-cluster-containing hydrogenase component 2
MAKNEHRQTGVLTDKQIQKMVPEKKGKIAVVECVEDIPCDPCVTACPSQALTMDSLIDIPELIPEKCGGCGLCIAECPGLAIFVIDFDYSPDKAIIMLPYEFIPLPKKGEKVSLLDRKGQVCGEGEIIKVRTHKNKTTVISVAVPKNKAITVRNVRRIA